MFQGAHVVDERVEPYVGHVALIEGKLDAPGQSALGARDAKIADRLTQHRHHFIFKALWSYEVGVLFQVTQQPLLVFAHAEEVIVFFDQLRLDEMIRTLASHKLLLCIEPLAAKAVKSAVAVEIDVASFIHLSQQFLHISDMVMIGGANEMIVSEATVIPGSAEGCADLVGKCFGVHPRLRGGLSDLVAMFVCAG